MVELKKILLLINFSIHITIQQRLNQQFLQAVIKEFQIINLHLVSANINHDFTLVKNIMARNQFVKVMTKIPNEIAPQSSIILNDIDTKERRDGAPKETARVYLTRNFIFVKVQIK